MSVPFQNCELGEIAELYDSLHQTPQYAAEGYPMIRVTDIRRGFVNTAGAVRVDEETYRQFSKKHRPQVGDILFSRVGSYGNSAYVSRNEEFCLGQNTVCISPQKSRIEPAFLYCALNSDDLRSQIESLVGGASQGTISLKSIRKLQVPIPPLPVQRRIASILSAYDELIENNQRRIKILEEMARSLYREWFVHFRFPGHNKVKMVPSRLGPIPQDWEICPLGDLVQFKSGFAFKSGTFSADGENRLVTIKNVQDGSFNPECDSRMNERPDHLPPHCILKDGDILLSLTGNVGRVCLVYDGPFFLNQRVAKLAPTESTDRALTYCMFRETAMRVKLEQLSNGVAQQNLSPVLASKMEVARPTRELRERFSALTEAMISRMIQLYSANNNLRRTRDLLLPRLLSGAIELASAGISATQEIA